MDVFSRELAFLRKWTSVCVAIDLVNKKVTLFLNGENQDHKKRLQQNYPSWMEKIPELKQGYVVTLSRYWVDGSHTFATWADVNVWDRELSNDRMEEYSKCKEVATRMGNVVNGTTKWTITGSVIKQVNVKLEDVRCDKNYKTLIVPSLYQRTSGLDSSNEICDKIERKSYLKHFATEEEWKEFYEEYSSKAAVVEECWQGGRKLIWMPYMDKDGDFVFHHMVTGEPVYGSNGAWMADKPRGEAERQCMVAYMGKPMLASWNDFKCTRPMRLAACAPCSITNSVFKGVFIILRGLCSNTAFERIFSVDNDADGYVMYYGKKGTIIQYSPANKVWEMRVMHKPNISATSKSSLHHWTIGNHIWNIQNDDKCQEGSVSKVLSFTTCPKDSYTCDNGVCIPIRKRCDGKKDCDNESDELGCSIINIPESYQKHISPPPERPEISDKLTLRVTIDLQKIEEINEIDSIFRVQFVLRMIWLDERFSYNNLKEVAEKNSLSPSEQSRIWSPSLTFYNTQFKDNTELDAKTRMVIRRLGNFTLTSMTEAENKEIYSGDENRLEMFRFYNTRFMCTYEMMWYPFDSQKCQMTFHVGGSSIDFINLAREEFAYSGPRDLMMYFIKQSTMQNKFIHGMQMVQVEIVLGRRLLSIILTVYIPTILLNIIGYVTNFFKDFFFEAIVTVNLTCMLVLATMFISVSEGLPKTAYIKMIDIWLIFNLLMPFIEVLLHTYMDNLREEDREVNHHGNAVSVGGTKADIGSSTTSIGSITPLRSPEEVLHVSPFEKNHMDTNKEHAAPTGSELIHRNEQVKVDSQRAWYKNAQVTNKRKLRLMRLLTLQGIPLLAGLFVAFYWIIGMQQYYI